MTLGHSYTTVWATRFKVSWELVRNTKLTPDLESYNLHFQQDLRWFTYIEWLLSYTVSVLQRFKPLVTTDMG
jgi:hypothetical protein